jgi:serine/threonine protein kinase
MCDQIKPAMKTKMFRSYPEQNEIKAGTWLKNNLITAVLKTHPKGNVFTALRFKYLVKRLPVVIKEANSQHPPDHPGRTERDKIKWQFNFTQKVSGHVNVPRVKDFFDYKGNTYLVMEYLEGTTFTKFLDRIYQNRIWYDLRSEDRLSILRVLLLLIQEVEKLHGLGFVHRDISPENILISPSGKLYLLDFELAYSLTEDYPSPPFPLGTAGFMSPEQLLKLRPAVTEDVFALGGVMLTAVTNFSPLKFGPINDQRIKDALDLFGVQPKISSLISGCMHVDKSYRPELRDIKVMLDQLLSASKSADDSFDVPKEQSPRIGSVKHHIDRYLTMLISKEFLEEHHPFQHETESGLAVPLQGIFYVMSLYGKENISGKVILFFKHLMSNCLEKFPLGRPIEQRGLFCGDAGNALAFCCAHDLGILDDQGNLPQCYLRLSDHADNLDLANGIAGQAMAILMILFKKSNDHLESNLQNMIKTLLDHQAADGSWPLDQLRLADGISGILLSLIKYYQLRQDDSILERLKKGLDFLARKYEEQDTDAEKSNAKQNNSISLVGGRPGIALILLYGYEIFKDPPYQRLADRILNAYNDKYCSFDFSLESGLAGIGIVYIEAARITGTTEWEKRAFWFYHLFNAMNIDNRLNQRCWNTKGKVAHDASLLSGNSGILYFMIKLQQYLQPNQKPIYQLSLF